MKRLLLREERERIRKKNQMTVGIILVFLMVASTLGFAIQGNLGNTNSGANSEKLTYNGFEFSYANGFWVLGSYVFRYNPEEVPNVNPDSALKNIDGYKEKPVYIQSESESAEAEIYVNLGQVAESVQKACLENTNCTSSENLPIKTCSDNFIIIKESQDSVSSINQINGCVYIEGGKENLVALTDQFLFKILGVR